MKCRKEKFGRKLAFPVCRREWISALLPTLEGPHKGEGAKFRKFLSARLQTLHFTRTPSLHHKVPSTNDVRASATFPPPPCYCCTSVSYQSVLIWFWANSPGDIWMIPNPSMGYDVTWRLSTMLPALRLQFEERRNKSLNLYSAEQFPVCVPPQLWLGRRHLNLLYIFSPFGFTTPWEGDRPNSYFSLLLTLPPYLLLPSSSVSLLKWWAVLKPSAPSPLLHILFFVDTCDRVGLVSLVTPFVSSLPSFLPPFLSPPSLCVYIFTATISSREIGYAKVLLSKENTRLGYSIWSKWLAQGCVCSATSAQPQHFVRQPRALHSDHSVVQQGDERHRRR